MVYDYISNFITLAPVILKKFERSWNISQQKQQLYVDDQLNKRFAWPFEENWK